MSENKATVRSYIEGFNKNDHAQILDCLTDDILWTVFRHFRLSGKPAYDAAIENEDFSGYPELHIVRKATRSWLKSMGEPTGLTAKKSGWSWPRYS